MSTIPAEIPPWAAWGGNDTCVDAVPCVPVPTEICGTPGYLAPEILQCSMDDEHQGYGKEVDM